MPRLPLLLAVVASALSGVCAAAAPRPACGGCVARPDRLYIDASPLAAAVPDASPPPAPATAAAISPAAIIPPPTLRPGPGAPVVRSAAKLL